MKMMSAAKLRRAQSRAEEAKPYAEKYIEMAQSIAQRLTKPAPQIFLGREKEEEKTKTLCLAIASARGLCGGYNANVAKKIIAYNNQKKNKENTTVILVGRKAKPTLQKVMGQKLLYTHEDVNRPVPHEAFAKALATEIISMFEQERFDRCVLFYNHFESVLTQKVVAHTMIPIGADGNKKNNNTENEQKEITFEPERNMLLQNIAPQIIAAQIFEAMLDAFAAEQAARMTAMDNATRNAGELIDELSLRYNRLRQASITTELIEIISGAEAL